MRIVKDANERRNEILDAADVLFSQKGFDGTSTGDLLEKVGIARGTLYYHFKSKEDIMDALIGRYTARILESAGEIAGDSSIPVYERMLSVVTAMNVRRGNGEEIIKQIHKPQNALMHQKTKRAVLKGVTPILTRIIEEGIEEGLFCTPYPYESMEMVIAYVNAVFDDDLELTGEELNGRIRAFIFNVERLLDAKGGELSRYMERMFEL